MKKRKLNTPRYKRLKREARLQAAKHWIPKYEGKSIIKGYSKHFGVSKLCAIRELEILGHKFKPGYIKQVEESLKAQEKTRQQHKLQKKQEENLKTEIDSDENFYYIAGYTPGGAPYGVTWEEAIKDELIEDSKLIEHNIFDYRLIEREELIYDMGEIPF